MPQNILNAINLFHHTLTPIKTLRVNHFHIGEFNLELRCHQGLFVLFHPCLLFVLFLYYSTVIRKSTNISPPGIAFALSLDFCCIAPSDIDCWILKSNPLYYESVNSRIMLLCNSSKCIPSSHLWMSRHEIHRFFRVRVGSSMPPYHIMLCVDQRTMM